MPRNSFYSWFHEGVIFRSQTQIVRQWWYFFPLWTRNFGRLQAIFKKLSPIVSWVVQQDKSEPEKLVSFQSSHKMTSAKNWCTLPETNSSHLKMDDWNTIVSFWDDLFSGAMLVSGSVGYKKIGKCKFFSEGPEKLNTGITSGNSTCITLHFMIQ